VNLVGDNATLYGIPGLLGSIVYNLCDNAIKYNHKDGSVTVEVTDNKNEVILSVSDTGIGIPSEDKDRIFERFYRVDKSHSKEKGGTGLGLSIVKHAARLHNAQITLDSVIDEGTTVRVNFPKNYNPN
ncbi:MAG: HAMP domain-containing sensor histidine kinase, partial [Acutalibacteraceae bacterium]|nr:HAMP domain-containing sensor histidine kinase [Acutalibacteraceae bacterium]